MRRRAPAPRIHRRSHSSSCLRRSVAMDGSRAAHCGSAPAPGRTSPPSASGGSRPSAGSSRVSGGSASIAIASRPVDGIAPGRALQALVEGAVLANYEGMSYKTADQPVAWLERVELRVVGDDR